MFGRKPRRLEIYRIDARSDARQLLALFFWLWGGGGFVLMCGEVFSLRGSIGVGTSAYLAAAILLWIGGMVLFGLGAIIAAPASSVTEAESDIRIEPR